MIKNLQALRGIAALLVLWQHTRVPLSILSPSSNQTIFQFFGPIGVDLFFIISGYVISLTALKKHHGPVDFFFARLGRVVPLYLLVSLFWIGIACLGHSRTLSFPSIWNGVFYLPIFDFDRYTSPPLDIGWTLSFEMWFYSAFALLLNFWNPKKVALLLPMLFLAGTGIITCYHGSWFFPCFMFHPFVVEFGLGCLIFLSQPWIVGKSPYLLILLGSFYFLSFSLRTNFLGNPESMLQNQAHLAWERVIFWGLPMALLAAGLIALEVEMKIVLPEVIVWIGGFSYSLYLTHRAVGLLVINVGRFLGWHAPLLIIPIMFFSSLVFAWACWTWIEKPLTLRAQNWLSVLARSLSKARTSPLPDSATRGSFPISSP